MRYLSIPSRLAACTALLGVFVFAACERGPTSPEQEMPGVSLATMTGPSGLTFDVTAGDFRVCKVGSQADFTVSVTEGGSSITADNPSFSLMPDECTLAHSDDGGDQDEVTITESDVEDGFQLDSIVIYAVDGEGNVTRERKVTGTNSVTGSIDAGKDGCTVIFYNSPAEMVGTGTPGYWMNHPDAWPMDNIVIGGESYTKSEAINEMSKPDRGDKTRTMFRALVAAKLNVANGADASCISGVISDADDWMKTNGPVGSGVKANSPAWQTDGEDLYETLDDYNNGELCAPSRDSLEEEDE